MAIKTLESTFDGTPINQLELRSLNNLDNVDWYVIEGVSEAPRKDNLYPQFTSTGIQYGPFPFRKAHNLKAELQEQTDAKNRHLFSGITHIEDKQRLGIRHSISRFTSEGVITYDLGATRYYYIVIPRGRQENI